MEKKEKYGIVSQKVAEKLAHAGFDTETSTYYQVNGVLTYSTYAAVCKAYRLHELLDALPRQIKKIKKGTITLGLSQDETDPRYYLNFGCNVFRSDNPADAVGEAILYCIEQKLI